MEDIKELRRKKRAFIELASVIDDMKKYGYKEIDEKEFLSSIQFYDKLYPLPSGNWGNILAVALELNYYIAAKCILDNNEELALDLNIIAYGDDGIYSLLDEYNKSLLTKMNNKDYENINKIEGLTKYKKYLYKNEKAFLLISDKYINKNKEKRL